MIKKVIEIPSLSDYTSISEFGAEIQARLQDLDYFDFIASATDKIVYNIDEKIKNTTSTNEIQTTLIPSLINHITKTTSSEILDSNGKINSKFDSITLLSYQPNIHTHQLKIKSKIDYNKNVILQIEIVDNETRTLGLNHEKKLILSNNAFRKLCFEYHPEIETKKITKNLFGIVKSDFEIVPATLKSFCGNNQIIEDLDKYATT